MKFKINDKVIINTPNNHILHREKGTIIKIMKGIYIVNLGGNGLGFTQNELILDKKYTTKLGKLFYR